MTQRKQNTTIPQLDNALLALSNMAQNITEEDRKAAVKLGLASSNTVSRYLTGNKNAKKLDTAIALIKFFQKRIKERDDLISSAGFLQATA